MDPCCETKSSELSALLARQRQVLVTVLAVNAAMFCIEFVAGIVSGSTALLADSLDMLGDSFVYGFSLFVLHRSLTWRARAALSKGVIMAVRTRPNGVAMVPPRRLRKTLAIGTRNASTTTERYGDLMANVRDIDQTEFGAAVLQLSLIHI